MDVKPPFFKGRHREWKAHKRVQLNEVLRAMDRYMAGSVYTPDFDLADNVRTQLQALRESISADNWGH